MLAFVHRRHLFASAAAGVLKGIFHNATALGDGDGLDRDGGIRGKGLLTRALDKLREFLNLGSALIELNAGVEVLGVLTHNNQVNVAEARAIARLRQAGAHAGVQVKMLAQGHVNAAETRATGVVMGPLIATLVSATASSTCWGSGVPNSSTTPAPASWTFQLIWTPAARPRGAWPA